MMDISELNRDVNYENQYKAVSEMKVEIEKNHAILVDGWEALKQCKDELTFKVVSKAVKIVSDEDEEFSVDRGKSEADSGNGPTIGLADCGSWKEEVLAMLRNWASYPKEFRRLSDMYVPKEHSDLNPEKLILKLKPIPSA